MGAYSRAPPVRPVSSVFFLLYPKQRRAWPAPPRSIAGAGRLPGGLLAAGLRPALVDGRGTTRLGRPGCLPWLGAAAEHG